MRFIVGLALMALVALPATAKDLKVYTANIPPFVIADSPERPGVAVEIMREVSKRTGIGVEVSILPWNRAQAEVMHGDDLAIMPLARIPEREGNYLWVGEIFSISTNFVTVDGRKHTLDTAKGVGSVLVQDGTSFKTDLVRYGFTNIRAVTDTATNARMFAAGRSDTWYVPELEALWQWKILGLSEQLTIGPSIDNEANWLAMSVNSDTELASKLAVALKAIIADGTRDRIISSYTDPSQ